MSDYERDDGGRLILGNPNRACEWCGANAEPTYSGNGAIAWWHPPFGCCKTRRHHQAMADRASTRDEAQSKAASESAAWRQKVSAP